ncbi:hypothetical protein LCGC14_2809680 [marine sediment metagenome]|uniref:MurNAc-LAA domain-containing protein n=1 Tax=marine sediment metagenome TaxID=412755 RepID=A0A0F8YK86_9ZZZZ
MMAKRFVTAAVTVLAGLSGGCNPPQAINPAHAQLASPPRTISVYQLAGRLGLQVVRNGRTFALLRGPANTVTIYPEPGPTVYVNGRRVSFAGPVRATDSTIFLSASAVDMIRRSLRPKPPPAVAPVAPTPPPRHVVVIDAGHGGRDPGAIATTGMFEKDVVLPIAQKVRQMLAADNVRVVMTRGDDRFIELNDRAAIANRARADLFVSIHANADIG